MHLAVGLHQRLPSDRTVIFGGEIVADQGALMLTRRRAEAIRQVNN